MPRPTLMLVDNTYVQRQTYTLPGAWEISITKWLEWLRMSGLSPATLRLRRDHLRSIARKSRTGAPGGLTRGQLLIIVTQQQWSTEHRKAIRSSLNSFYEWAIAEGLADDNVSQCLPKVRQPIPNPRPAPDHVWVQLLADARPRERLMALLAGEAGLRRAEVAQVNVDDLIDSIDGYSLLVHGKGGKQRVVPLTARLAAEIRTYRNHGYLFPGQIDGHLSAQYVGVLISRLMPEAWSMHKLRHRYATRGYDGTHNLLALSECLGHSSVATTQRYVAVSSQDKRLVSEAAGNGNNVA